jgi:glutamate racemase
LVEQVESGRLDTPDTDAMLRRYLAPMMQAGVDTIVLACTHYPFLAPAIRRIVGPGVQVIDPAPAIARQVERVIEQRGLRPAGQPGQVFYTTGDVTAFAETLDRLAGATGAIRAARWDEMQVTGEA